MTLAEIKAETLKVSILQEVSTHFRDNTWHKLEKSQHVDILKRFCCVSIELTTSPEPDIILRGTRIVIPITLQENNVIAAEEWACRERRYQKHEHVIPS